MARDGGGVCVTIDGGSALFDGGLHFKHSPHRRSVLVPGLHRPMRPPKEVS